MTKDAPDTRRRKCAFGPRADFDGRRSLVFHHRATELIRKLDSRPAIGKAPAHVVVAIFVMSGPPVLRPNIMPSMKIVYNVQCFAQATERYDNFYDMRKIPLDRFEASAASGVCHQPSSFEATTVGATDNTSILVKATNC
jgi:hypothetical protein